MYRGLSSVKFCPHIDSDGNSSLKNFLNGHVHNQQQQQDSVLLRGFVVPQGDKKPPFGGLTDMIGSSGSVLCCTILYRHGELSETQYVNHSGQTALPNV